MTHLQAHQTVVLDSRYLSCNKSSRPGQIWISKPKVAENGILSIYENIKRAPSVSPIAFRDVAFSPNGRSFATVDATGKPVLFDVQRNRYYSIGKSNGSPTCLQFVRNSEIIVGNSHGGLSVYGTENREQICTLSGHLQAITHISVSLKKKICITCSEDNAQVWDTDNWIKLRSLGGASEIGITKVGCSGNGELIAAVFRNGQVSFWNGNSFLSEGKFNLSSAFEGVKLPYEPLFCLSSTGSVCVAGPLFDKDSGQSSVAVIDIDAVTKLRTPIQNALKIMVLPSGLNEIHTMEFLRGKSVIAALTATGKCCIFSIDTGTDICNLIGWLEELPVRVGDIGDEEMSGKLIDDGVLRLSLAPKGTYLATVTKFSGRVVLYDCEHMLSMWGYLVKEQKEKKEKPDPRNDWIKSHTITKESANRIAAREDREPLFLLAKMNDKSRNLNIGKLRGILEIHGSFPSRYRSLIWRFLLQCPENEKSFAALLDLGSNAVWKEKLATEFPIKGQRVAERLLRILSALSHWSPVFTQPLYLPNLCFPFVKVFGGDLLGSFEVCATVLSNWCSNWFEFVPNAPFNVLHIVDSLIDHFDPTLGRHFTDHDINALHHTWPMLQNLYSEVLSGDSWLQAMDHLFARPPKFLLFLSAAYIIHFRAALLKVTEKRDLDSWTSKQHPVNVHSLFNLADSISNKAGPNAIPESEIPNFEALSQGQYGVFNRYSKYMVDTQIQEQARALLVEEEIVRKREELLTLYNRAEKAQAAEEAFIAKQEALTAAEALKKLEIDEENERRAHEERRLDELVRLQRLRHIATKEELTKHQYSAEARLREEQLEKLEKDLLRKQRETDEVLKNRAEEEALLDMEFESDKRLTKAQREISKNISTREFQAEVNAKTEKARVDAELLKEAWKAEDEEQRVKMEYKKEKRGKELIEKEDAHARQEMRNLISREEKNRELKINKIERERRLRKIAMEEEEGMAEAAEMRKRKEAAVERENALLERQVLQRERAYRNAQEKLREKILVQAKRKHALEGELRLKELDEIERRHRIKEIEQEGERYRLAEHESALKEEQRLQDILFKLEDARKKETDLEAQIRLKREEMSVRERFKNEAKRAASRAVQDERTRFAAVRDRIQKETEVDDEETLKRHQRELEDLRTKYDEELSRVEKDFKLRAELEELSDIEAELVHIKERRKRRERSHEKVMKKKSTAINDLRHQEESESGSTSFKTDSTNYTNPSSTTYSTSQPPSYSLSGSSTNSSPSYYNSLSESFTNPTTTYESHSDSQSRIRPSTEESKTSESYQTATGITGSSSVPIEEAQKLHEQAISIIRKHKELRSKHPHLFNDPDSTITTSEQTGTTSGPTTQSEAVTGTSESHIESHVTTTVTSSEWTSDNRSE